MAADLTGTTTLLERIQRTIIHEIGQGPFLKCEYDGDKLVVTVEEIEPTSVSAHEVSSTYGSSRVRNRMTNTYDRETWVWNALVNFPAHVSCEAAEARLQNNVILVPKDKTLGLRQATLRFTNVEYQHPPRSDSRNGSQVRYVIEAQLSPL